MQTNPQEQLVNMEVDTTTQIINETKEPNNLATIITCTIFVITGQCTARLVETFHNHHNFYQSLHDGVWTQPFLQVIGFPLLLLPFFFLSTKKHNQLLITSQPSSLSLLLICTGVTMLVQARLYTKGKLESPFTKLLLLDGTRFYFTPIFAATIKRTKFNVWIVFSLVYTIAITTLSFYVGGELSALFSAFTFIFLLGNIQKIFDVYISKGNKKVKPVFADVLELLIFSSLFATLAAFFISGEKHHHDLMREMEGFSKGKTVYVMTMVGQVVAWQMYWVGVVGLVVFAESIVTSNSVSLSAYPIIMVLEILFFNYEDDEFDGYLGAALVLYAFIVVSSLYKTRYKDVRVYEISKRSRLFLVLVSLFVYHLYISELLNSDPYMSPPTEFDFFEVLSLEN